MGQRVSREANSVYVTFEQPVYCPGDTVTGSICLNCVTPFQCASVELKVSGYEECRWQEFASFPAWDTPQLAATGSSGGAGRHGHHAASLATSQASGQAAMLEYHGRRNFFSVLVPVHACGARLAPGQYQFPFSFVLPAGLPGVFDYQGASVTAHVCYKVKALCRQASALAPALKDTQPLVVYQRAFRDAPPPTCSQDAEVTSCCCCTRGSAEAEAALDAGSYAPGDTAHLTCRAKNDSAVDFSSLQVRVMRRLELHALETTSLGGGGWHPHAFGGGGQRKELVDCIWTYSYPGLPAGLAWWGVNERRVPLFLDAHLPPQTDGGLVRCHYWLDVRLRPPACPPCTSGIALEVPLPLHAPAPPAQQLLAQAPPEWKPQVFEAVRVEVPSAPPLPPAVQQMPDRRGGPAFAEGWAVASSPPVDATEARQSAGLQQPLLHTAASRWLAEAR